MSLGSSDEPEIYSVYEVNTAFQLGLTLQQGELNSCLHFVINKLVNTSALKAKILIYHGGILTQEQLNMSLEVLISLPHREYLTQIIPLLFELGAKLTQSQIHVQLSLCKSQFKYFELDAALKLRILLQQLDTKLPISDANNFIKQVFQAYRYRKMVDAYSDVLKALHESCDHECNVLTNDEVMEIVNETLNAQTKYEENPPDLIDELNKLFKLLKLFNRNVDIDDIVYKARRSYGI